MKSKIADIFEEVDATLSKLSWVLFKQEMEFLWTDPLWTPGEPLYVRPVWRCCDECEIELDTRPMYEILDDDDLEGDDSFPEFLRCDPCGVDWVGDDPCWMCGKRRWGNFLRGTTWNGLTEVKEYLFNEINSVFDVEVFKDMVAVPVQAESGVPWIFYYSTMGPTPPSLKIPEDDPMEWKKDLTFGFDANAKDVNLGELYNKMYWSMANPPLTERRRTDDMA